ncbi:uncharacterized protein LOC110976538 [Acanthaster planci]|uniref:Uncharacterized protein LOC110976538 n=1 Tax=Acanthaster planci TaxID=133434 RepID=A0A8B7Y0U0_ACAPL|nr:uncharacterized protein LOC110976538 [Acanthaster planci]
MKPEGASYLPHVCGIMLCWMAIMILCGPVIAGLTWPDATLSYTTEAGQSIVVLDEIIPETMAAALRNYVLRFSRWKLRGAPETRTYQTTAQGCTPNDTSPWTAQLSSRFHKNACFLKDVVHVSSPKLENFIPCGVQAEILRRGDSTEVSCGQGQDTDYSWRVFLTPDWQINDYGDLIFYSRNDVGSENQDAMLTVTPRMGRIVLWDSSLLTLYHPPSMGYIQGLLSISGKLKCKDSAHHRAKQDKFVDTEPTPQPSFSSALAQSGEVLDFAEKQVQKFYDSRGKTIAVYDNLFSAIDLEQLQQDLAAQGETGYLAYDLQQDEDVDNAQWVKSFNVDKFVTSAVWKRMSDVTRHASGNRTTWHPYDVSLNIVRSADHTRIHQDCDEWEDEYTLVLYLNPDWHPEFYGETVFFEAVPGSQLSRQLYGLNGETEYQPFASVLPKYGRLAVFQGIIPHSARPPGSLFTGARYTFAVKVSLTRKIALAKRLQETLEDGFEELAGDEQQLLEDLISGDYNRELSFRSEEWLEKRLHETLQKAAEVKQNDKSQLESAIFTCE